MKLAAAAPPVLLGFSGGGDSLALLLRYRAEGRIVQPVIVDHAVREGSAQVAEAAAAMARRHGAAAEMVRLDWSGSPPAGQAAWRRARLGALLQAARGAGVQRVALAHTQDDQAETVALRLQSRSGWRGLAGMAALSPFPMWPEGRGLLLERPLLQTSRATLRAELRAHGADWLEDPANVDPRFARVRARASLAQAPQMRERLLALADAAAAAAAELDAAALELRGLVRAEEDRLLLPRQALAAAPDLLRGRLLAVAAAAAGSAQYVVPEGEALRLWGRLQASPRGVTLAGAKFEVIGDHVCLRRDPGAVCRRGRLTHAARALAAGEPTVWDGRAELLAPAPGWEALADPLGRLRLKDPGGARLKPQEALGAGLQIRWLLELRMQNLLWRGLPRIMLDAQEARIAPVHRMEAPLSYRN